MTSVRSSCLATAAHHEDFHRRVVLDAVLNSLQPAVIPAQAKFKAVDRGARAEVGVAVHRHHVRAMNPRPEDHPHRPALVLRQRRVAHGGLPRPRVVPSADQEHRHILVCVDVVGQAEAGLLPVCVVLAMAHRMDDPLFILGCEAKRRRAFANREVGDVAADIRRAFIERRFGCRIARRVTAFRRGHREDPVGETQFPRTAVAHPEVAGIDHRIDRHQRSKAGRIRQRHRMLSAADVGGADHAEATITPRLLHEPSCGVEAVGDIVDHHAPDALGLEPAASVLRDADVTAARVEGLPWVRRHAVEAAALVIRRTLQNGGKLAFDAFAVARRIIDVRGEADPIAHRHHHVALDDVERRRRRAESSAAAAV